MNCEHLIPAAECRLLECHGAPTARQVQVFATYLRCGSMKEAGASSGITANAVHHSNGRLYATLGVLGWIEAATVLGWLRVPAPRSVSDPESSGAIPTDGNHADVPVRSVEWDLSDAEPAA